MIAGDNPIIRFLGVTKAFPGIVALRQVSFDVRRGVCHGLVGENGAGKSTLGKILAGILPCDAGRIEIDGRPAAFKTPRDALAAGVVMVHQELAFCENLSVAENLCLGELPHRGPFVDRAALRRRAAAMLDMLNVTVDLEQPLGDLSVAQQQLVQIAGAINRGAGILIFDEPTSSLSQVEASHLLDLIRRLKKNGVTSIYISHHLDEIFQICDAVTVLRDGQHIATKPIGEVTSDALVQLMIGRDLQAYFPGHLTSEPGPVRLQVRGLSSPEKFDDISFSVRAGEILGLAGLVGAGRTEIVQALFGLDPHTRGEIRIDGKPVAIGSPAQAMRHGLALVPEDRKRFGLVLSMTAGQNITLPTLDRLATASWISSRAEARLADRYFSLLRIKATGPEAATEALSGGNQQKLVLARWLAAQARILLIDEPTRGVDVGAKAEIHIQIDQLAREGCAVILVSSELPEIINLSTRVLVLRNGRIAGRLTRNQINQGTILRLMAGIEDNARGSITSSVPIPSS